MVLGGEITTPLFTFFSPVRGGPGEIRGRQMAEKLNGQFNPIEYHSLSTVIYVLGASPSPEHQPQAVYHDVLDCGPPRLGRVYRYRGDLISVSEVQYVELSNAFKRRKVWLIPQHHCNFNRELRPSRPVRRVGCIGGDSAVQWPHHAMQRMFAEVGLEWCFSHDYSRRNRVVEFYRHLDVQVSWRPTHARGIINHMNVLKLSNAGSFGIPTVAYPEPAYVKEWPDGCLYEDTIYGLVRRVKSLADNPSLYDEMSNMARSQAERYHIDNIAELYRQLPTEN